MKSLILATILTAGMLSSEAIPASPHHSHYRSHHERETIVIEIKRRPVHAPVYVEECWIRERYYPVHDSRYRHMRHEAASGMITGGITGGLIGHELGRRLGSHHDRAVFTLLGTLVGASIGHDLAYRPTHREKRPIYRKYCRQIHHY